MKKIGKRIRELREQNGYSQTQVAKYLGIDQSNLSKIERGERKFKLSLLNKLCSLYNCSQDYILCKSDEYENDRVFNIDNNVDLNIIAIINETMNDLKLLRQIKKQGDNYEL